MHFIRSWDGEYWKILSSDFARRLMKYNPEESYVKGATVVLYEPGDTSFKILRARADIPKKTTPSPYPLPEEWMELKSSLSEGFEGLDPDKIVCVDEDGKIPDEYLDINVDLDLLRDILSSTFKFDNQLVNISTDLVEVPIPIPVTQKDYIEVEVDTVNIYETVDYEVDYINNTIKKLDGYWSAGTMFYFKIAKNGTRTKTDDAIFGTGRYNSTDGFVINHQLNSLDYTVHVTTSSESDGNIGDVYVTDKTENSFIVRNTGTNTEATFDWTLLVVDTTTDKPASGTAIYNSTDGIEIIHNNGTPYYSVLVSTTSETEGDVGEIYVTNKTADSFWVYNTGRDTTSSFDWFITK